MPQSRKRGISPRVLFVLALMIAIPLSIIAQAPQGGGRGGRGGRGGAPAGAPGAPGAPPAGGPAAAAPAGQRGGGGAGAKAAAPVDLTGYWVSIVTEDWIERMCPDCPGSGTGNGRGTRGPAPVTLSPNADQCRAYAAGGSLRAPGRLNITWADDNLLKIEMDAGTQTRLVHFNSNEPVPAEKTLQGYSVGTWETGGGGRGGGGGFGGGGGRGGAGGGGAAARWGSLKVVTTNMKGGYLLSSRASYSDNATLTEYFIRHSDFGAEYFTVEAQLDDGRTIVTSSTFKKEPNGSKFSPAGCEIVR